MHAFLLVAALCADPDIESMKLALQSRIAALEVLNGARKGGGPSSTSVVTPTVAQDAPNADSGVTEPETAAPESVSQTAVCQCRGSNRGVCFCLQNRVACKCNAGKGSEWNLVDGRAVSKTGRYADPRREASAIARSDAPAASAPSIRINMADFHCPACNVLKGYDWTGFNVEWVTGGASVYPQISWLDKRGTRRVLTGAYKPSRVMWSWKATQ